MLIERGLLRSAGAALRDLVPSDTRVFVLTAPPIRKHWASTLREGLSKAGFAVDVLIMPDGERSKNLAQLEKLAETMLKRGADRGAVLVTLGGGVVGDVGGFLASVFMRGIPVVQVPTTLLAQVDSAIGGKTGVNLRAGKNLVGTFHQPLLVLADPDVLATLPEREYRSGMWEAMKYGVIRNPAIFDLMEKHRDAFLNRRGDLLKKLIAECVRIKADVVGADEREGGERRILNFGHTVGHALEAETQYKHFRHGEAVGWGMIAAARIGEQFGITNSAVAQRITDLVLSYGPLPKVKVSAKSIYKRLLTDKKSVAGVPHFVLASSIGKVEITNQVSPKAVIAAIEHIKRLS